MHGHMQDELVNRLVNAESLREALSELSVTIGARFQSRGLINAGRGRPPTIRCQTHLRVKS